MKTWSHIPGVTYPKGLKPRRVIPMPKEPHLCTAQVAALFRCTEAHARRLAAKLTHGGGGLAVNPDTGKLTRYWPEAPIRAHYETHLARYTAPRGTCPAGYCTAAVAIGMAGNYKRLRRAVDTGAVKRVPGHTASGNICHWYSLADLRKLPTR